MVIWRNLFSDVKRRALILAAVPLLSLLSLFTPFFAQNASAVTPNDVLNRARAWSILSAIIEEAPLLDSKISNEDADNCAIFGSADNDTVYVGHHVTEQNETSTISGASWDALEDRVDLARGALASIAPDNGLLKNGCRGLLEAIGYTSRDGAMHQPRNYRQGDGELIAKLRAAVRDDAFFGAHVGDVAPGDAISYAMLIYLLKNTCGWQYRNPYVENDNSNSPEMSRNREAQNNGWGGDSNKSHFHTYTYENGRAGENTYFKDGGRTDDIYVGAKTGFASNGSEQAQIDCGDKGNGDVIGAKLHDNPRFADAYARLLQPGGQYTPGTCGEKYQVSGTPAEIERGNALRTACDEGYKNKAPGYCDKFNADQGLKDACLYGQGQATGGASDVSPPVEDNTQQTSEDKTTCAIPGIGWLLCPGIELAGRIIDGIYSFVAALLEVQPLTNDSSSGLFQAWSVMRNFANVAFVIVFLIIIFSQVTSIGITNYGIKRMLPRLVIAAILVNASFWICAIAVDLSNIGGSSLNQLFGSIGQSLSLPDPDHGFNTSNGWQGIIGAVLTGTFIAGALYVALAALIPMLIACLFVIATVFVALVIRQALIILLIVIAPLAFVAYLLPNTEALFTRWRRVFTLLLIMYPAVGLMFGASALASQILMGGS